MSEKIEQNEEIARRFVTEFLGKGNLTVADELLHENIQAYTGLKPDGPIDGREQYKQIVSGFVSAFPAAGELEILDVFATETRAVVRFDSPQKHTQEFFGVAATNRLIHFIEAHIMRIENGVITENIVSATNLEFEMLMAPVLAPLILK